jgi:hypothetical protein
LINPVNGYQLQLKGDVKMSNGTASTDKEQQKKSTGVLAFTLVVIMLGTLFILVLALLGFIKWLSPDKDVLEFGKWTISVLLGAFGAWIGAGAAYFFGRENLAESSRSTERAMEIQQQALGGLPKLERIRDLNLSAMNKEFMFKPASKKKEVIEKLELSNNKGYWWVPVLDKDGEGILVDIINARVFSEPSFNDEDEISKILSDIDTNPNFKAKYGVHHGDSFFVSVKLDDKIAEVSDMMSKSGAAVGVIVDEKGKPAYCFTKQFLPTAQK